MDKSALFQVYLRLRPSSASSHAAISHERFLTVEEPAVTSTTPHTAHTTYTASPTSSASPLAQPTPTHITLNPPNDNRRRAVEKFAFTQVFEEGASQLDVFEGTGVRELVEGVLGSGEGNGSGRDGLCATLGVTGSGKTHTILGSKSQRGLTQLALDVLYRSIEKNVLHPATSSSLHATIAAADPSEGQVMSAQMFLETTYSDNRASSRATTPMVVRIPHVDIHVYEDEDRDGDMHPSSRGLYPSLSSKNIRVVSSEEEEEDYNVFAKSAKTRSNTKAEPGIPLSRGLAVPSYMQSTIAKMGKYIYAKSEVKGELNFAPPPPTPRRHLLQRPSVLPQLPDISNITIDADPYAEYAILISMYEVYNDRIFDLLTPALPGKSTKDFRRRPLLFKPTEQSPDRKVVAGLRKVICGTMKEALMVLEAGLHERRVAGTGSNSTSSRSHGFFCVEVKKRRRRGSWTGNTLTIVDLAGSERARDAKTQGATLQEAGKINESLMYLGQCLQMQSDIGNTTKPNLVPFRQCKLTELLFSNSFTPSSLHNPQRATMIVTADPLGDFNATSQILRYSALAREITVPRIPSVTSTILAQSNISAHSVFSPTHLGRNGLGSGGRQSPTDTERETMEIAALEIARLSEEIDGLREALSEESERRMEAEAHLESMTDRVMEVECQVREEVFSEMEERMAVDMRRWKATLAAEAERGEEHLDRKLEILTKTIDVTDDEGEDKENQGMRGDEELRDENEKLRREIEQLKRELQGRSPSKSQSQSPSKRLPLRESRSSSRRLNDSMEALRISGSRSSERLATSQQSIGSGSVSASPTKKIRKLTAKKWDMAGEEELL